MKGIGRTLAALAGIAAISVGLVACGSDDEGEGTGGETLSLRIGYVTTPQHPYGIAIQAFADEVKEASGGSIDIKPLANASNGNDVTLLDDVVGGTIEMAGVSTAVWDSKGVNVFQPLQAPFLITNYPLSQQVLGGEIGQGMLDSPAGPAKLKLKGLGILEGGLRVPVGREAPFKTPADFAGKKFRAPSSKVMSSTLEALGAVPSPMPLGDVLPSLQTGKIDGLEANYGLIFTQKFNEAAKFVTRDVVLWPFPAAVVINQAQWDKLNDEQKEILTQAGKNLAENSVNVFLNPAPDATNFVAELCKAGLTFAVAGDANRAALAEKAKPALDELAAGADTGDFLKQIQDLKAELGAPAPPPALPDGCKTA